MTCPKCGGKPPSSPQHRRMMKVFSVAHDHWPETDGFQPKDSDHLRGFVAVQAGWSTSHTVRFSDGQPEAFNASIATLQAMGRLDGYCEIGYNVESKTITKTVPKSMSFEKMNHKERCAYFQLFEDVIAEHLHVRNCDELLKQAERAA